MDLSRTKWILKRRLRQLVGQELNYRARHLCRRQRFGSTYGGWWVCRDRLEAQSVVYSVGIGTDITFDLDLMAEVGCQIHAFDPTPASLNWLESQDLPKGFVVHPWGLADFDGTARLGAPDDPAHVSHSMLRKEPGRGGFEAQLFTLDTVMRRLGHTHIDLLKMDIEGAEYVVIDDLIRKKLQVGQLLVEYHHRMLPGITLADTRRSINVLRAAGYHIFAISPTGHEYHFLYRGNRQNP